AVIGTVGTCTEIDKLALNDGIEIYPNPNNGSSKLVFNTSAKDDYLLEVRNALGQSVYHEILEDFTGTCTRTINLNSYGKGIYILTLSNSSTTRAKKIMVY
ncbi:MAG: T9SS type A sorting domain-containing protein, partial [Bacteroidetes bacterium]|nr:T9SS type A sorting domain-containing protein [Bacteroidota bacterium]